VERARALEAQANLVHAEARLKVAQANLAHTEILIEYAQIRAPYDGIITRRWVDSGDFVTSAANSKSEPLFTVDRADKPLRIVFDVPENESSLIQLGQLAVLEVDALKGRSFDGRIKRTTGVLDPRTRTLRAEVELDGAESGLRPGLYGMITVTLAERPQALMVTTRCLRYENGQPFVFCAGKGVVEKRAVSVGYSDGIRTEIVDGIDASDLIVVESRSPIHPGDTVRVAMSE
jgi:membrane fusion protein (multidrug efflux system)